ncbi:GNAT family N-acetyltransferase [Streptomyces sp. VRA16 Mangrove soil]|uniref:GNAT family N-acetyltransferase n=1 Tax=Streptomyces sp. VRA16 Mangrove soil TaxID=2817434 RepID=UPI001A9F832D|nr:GNAT family N-acetyltransferase [Streptomyces sp. VRA16 Mangrove soil]MBO1331765.1 GNAT family N-acetyltransferase [Streptomyces sp. VRA16 Mangrove soil]
MPSLVTPVLPAGTLSGRPQPTLPAGAGLTLRPWAEPDAPAVHTAFRDPTIQQWHSRRTASPDEARELIRGWRAAWAGEVDAHWAVADAATDDVLGRISLRETLLAGGLTQVAYWTLPAARGRGVAPRAVEALTRWAFDEIGFHRIELNHAVSNGSSCRVALKCGFAAEGTARSALLHRDGWHDMHRHARVRSDPAPGAGA